MSKEVSGGKRKHQQSLLEKLEAAREAPPLLKEALDHTTLKKTSAVDLLQELSRRLVRTARDGLSGEALLQDALEPYLR